MKYLYDDGGRLEAGYTGSAGDCAVRAVAITLGITYQETYDALWVRKGGSPRDGVTKKVLHDYLIGVGYTWTPTMRVGTGCRVHLKDGELPGGRLIVRLSKHVAAVVDGVLHDTYDSSRGETRCVYGYWVAPRRA